MNKTELINAVAEKAGLSKKAAEAAVNATLSAITEGLKTEEKVQLVGFGSFEVKHRAERTGLNPRTKEPVTHLQGRQGAEGRYQVRDNAHIEEKRRRRFSFLSIAFRRSTMRLDKYLKVSRLIKRRTVANEACDNERVTVNGRVARASYDVKVGDVITIRFGQKSLSVEVVSVADNVGKADAALMYRETTDKTL